MPDVVGSQPQKRLKSEVVFQSKWATVYDDRVLSNAGNELEYIRVDRSDSVIIIVRQNDQFILTPSQYRPGIDTRTLDFPGGRVDGEDPLKVAERTVRRELALDASVEIQLKPIIDRAFFVDSAFTNQKLYGFIADLPGDVNLEYRRYSADELLGELVCLQCRALLNELLLNQDLT